MQQHNFLWSVVAWGVIAGLGADARATLASASDCHVAFEAKGPAGFKITGATGELAVKEDGGNLVLTVPLGNLNTGIDLRDHHMKEKYLEVPKFPVATLTVARSALKWPSPGERVEADVPATLALHGETRPISVHYDAKNDGPSLLAHGQFHINMNEFAITVPSYLGVTVKPDVDVKATFRAAGN